MRTLRFVRYVVGRFPLLLAIDVLLMVLSSFFDTLTMFTIAPVIDLIVHPGLQNASPLTQKTIHWAGSVGIPVSLKSILIILMTLYTLMNLFQILTQYGILRAKYAVLRDLCIGTFDDFFNASWNFFSGGTQGVLLNTFMRELSNIGESFSALGLLLACAIQLVFYLAIPFYLSWRITLICIAATSIFTVPFFLIGKISYRLGIRSTATANRFTSIIHENLSMAKVVLGFGNQAKSSSVLAESFADHSRAAVKALTLTNSITNVYQPLGLLILIVAFVSAKRLGVPLAETAVLILSLIKVVPTVGRLVTQNNALENYFPSYEQLIALRQRAKALEQKSGPLEFTRLKEALTLDHVTFAHQANEPTVSEICLRIPKGKMVALVGASGAGKSTLIDVIMGFNQPTSGRVCCDGVPLTDFDINSYRRAIGYVPQDSILFNTSIRENLLWANDRASDQDIRRACRQAHADEFIDRLPEEYETQLGDRGVRLSGGQIQRLALARAILRRPEIMILDEATSSLDTHSERLIQQAIEEISKETTTVVITHRISTIVNADYIYVLSHGRIVEEGRYADLAGKNGEFHRMVQLQALQGSR